MSIIERDHFFTEGIQAKRKRRFSVKQGIIRRRSSHEILGTRP